LFDLCELAYFFDNSGKHKVMPPEIQIVILSAAKDLSIPALQANA
jgi:hypothetical protein